MIPERIAALCHASHFNAEKFEDQCEDALKELLKKKQSGQKIESPREDTVSVSYLGPMPARSRRYRALPKRRSSTNVPPFVRLSEKGAVSIYGMGRFPGLSCWTCRTTFAHSLLRTKRN
jgi:hypothetical protein